jgi:hypothetical protein
MSVAIVTSTLTVGLVGAGHAAGAATTRSAATATATPACTFNGGTFPIVTDVSEGSKIAIACTGLPALTPYLLLQASLLIGIDPKAAALLSGGTPSASTLESALAALPEIDAASFAFPVSNLSGDLNYTYTVPNFQPTDPNATCPPSQLEFNTGLLGCALAMVDLETQKPLAAGSAVLEWTEYPFIPPDPTIAFSATKKLEPGQVIDVTDAPGNTTYWWLATLASLEALLGGSSSSPPTSSVVFEGKHNVIVPAVSSITVTPASYDGKTLTVPTLTGNFTVPSGLTGKQKVIVMYDASLDGNALGIQTITPVKM